MIITFDEFLLKRKNYSKLYHFTTQEFIYNILKENRMKGSFLYDDVNGKEYYGVSTTINSKLYYKGQTCRITLDGTMLSDSYRIVPYNYWYGEYDVKDNPQTIDEDEEIIMTPKKFIFNIKKYIISID
jgi:hypothetical protein